MKDLYAISLEAHEKAKGKFSVEPKVEVNNIDDLSIYYSPGVAEPCRKIAENVNNAYKYTAKGNMLAIITDGSAVLGLGDIGPEAGIPVLEGKSMLFKKLAGIDAMPIALGTKDTEQIIQTIKNISPSFGAIDLEDIGAPRCIEIETRLKKELDIPVFHDDQHGASIAATAGMINAFKLVGKKFSDVKAVVCGAGAAGSSIIKMLIAMGVHNILAVDKMGILRRSDKDYYDFNMTFLAEVTNIGDIKGDLGTAIEGADIFIGVSAANILTRDMVRRMNRDPVIFAMANPTPEIMPADAKEAGARVVGTGRSDFPNQINNILVFPGIFKGALSARARKITDSMKMAAAYGIASLVSESELREDYVVPGPLDPRLADTVADAVARKAIEEGVCRREFIDNKYF
ncbi:MAG: NADP-dependent malic enzyme [Fusobacteriaceae bacterium]|nr:NADP-dependent malic enzyme [Fusobacteriaceae bacterium]